MYTTKIMGMYSSVFWWAPAIVRKGLIPQEQQPRRYTYVERSWRHMPPSKRPFVLSPHTLKIPTVSTRCWVRKMHKHCGYWILESLRCLLTSAIWPMRTKIVDSRAAPTYSKLQLIKSVISCEHKQRHTPLRKSNSHRHCSEEVSGDQDLSFLDGFESSNDADVAGICRHTNIPHTSHHIMIHICTLPKFVKDLMTLPITIRVNVSATSCDHARLAGYKNLRLDKRWLRTMRGDISNGSLNANLGRSGWWEIAAKTPPNDFPLTCLLLSTCLPTRFTIKLISSPPRAIHIYGGNLWIDIIVAQEARRMTLPTWRALRIRCSKDVGNQPRETDGGISALPILDAFWPRTCQCFRQFSCQPVTTIWSISLALFNTTTNVLDSSHWFIYLLVLPLTISSDVIM